MAFKMLSLCLRTEELRLPMRKPSTQIMSESEGVRQGWGQTFVMIKGLSVSFSEASFRRDWAITLFNLGDTGKGFFDHLLIIR